MPCSARPGRRATRPPPPEIPQALVEALVETVFDDFERYGAQVIARLREHPKQYAALLKACTQFQLLARQRAVPIGPRRTARPVRTRQLVEALDRQPVDPACPRLPLHLRPRFHRVVERLGEPVSVEVVFVEEVERTQGGKVRPILSRCGPKRSGSVAAAIADG